MDLWSNVMISFSPYCLWTQKEGQKEILFKVKGISHFIVNQESWSRKYTDKKNKKVKEWKQN